MYKKILVPLDGSKRAESILPYVEDLAHCFGSQVILLHVVEPCFSSLGPHSTQLDFDNKLNEQRVLEARKYLAGLQGEFREKKINTRACVERGSVLGNINVVIERENPDLIAIASHGRTDLPRIIYGSIAAGVLHQVEQPLLLIRTDGEF